MVQTWSMSQLINSVMPRAIPGSSVLFNRKSKVNVMPFPDTQEDSSNRSEQGRKKRAKSVQFADFLFVVNIESREELENVATDIFWEESDYIYFKRSAIQEITVISHCFEVSGKEAAKMLYQSDVDSLNGDGIFDIDAFVSFTCSDNVLSDYNKALSKLDAQLDTPLATILEDSNTQLSILSPNISTNNQSRNEYNEINSNMINCEMDNFLLTNRNELFAKKDLTSSDHLRRKCFMENHSYIKEDTNDCIHTVFSFA